MEEIKEIFDEIDRAIEECKSDYPVIFKESRFKRLYEEIKKKWLK